MNKLINKSSITNLTTIAIIIAGHFSPFYKNHILSVGYFALSGAITNWLAIHMLFEKIPFLYGSGVIPNRFQDFKFGIKNLIMGQFFNEENIKRFFLEHKKQHDIKDLIKFDSIIDSIDYEKLFNSLVQVILDSSFGGMLSMFGGIDALAPLKGPFSLKMKEAVGDITKSDKFLKAIESSLGTSDMNKDIISKVEGIVTKRLDELTPQMVKKIIQEMIQKHLGWLVIWGGVFGGIIGLIMSLLS